MAIDWGQIGTNVLNSLATKLPEIGLSALSAAIAPKIEVAKQKTAAQPAAQQAAQPAAAPAALAVQQAPAVNWQKYVPYAIGGAVLLGAVYMFTRRGKG